MKRIILLVFIINISNYIIFPQVSIEDSNYMSSYRRWEEADRGIIINRNDTIINIYFENNYGRKIFYIGEDYRGFGIFYLENNGNKIIILETAIRYGPAIIWHGENVAEIIIPTGSPFTHSYFYNFIENKLSYACEFPLYYDIENDYVLLWGYSDFAIFDVIAGTLVNEFYYRRKININWSFSPNIIWFIEKINERQLKMYWKNDEFGNGIFIFEY